MLDLFLSLISPHYCLLCGKVEKGLCYCCNKNIKSPLLNYCVICNKTLKNNQCFSNCKLNKVKQYVCYQREGVIKQLVHEMKFGYAREHSSVLVSTMPVELISLPNNSLIIPIPTSSKHVRQRGFDHTKLLAKNFAKSKKLKYTSLFGRNFNTAQVGSNRQQRLQQTKGLFYCKNKNLSDRPIVLLDDVITTGATITSAVNCLHQAGYKDVSIVAIAHQPLEELS